MAEVTSKLSQMMTLKFFFGAKPGDGLKEFAAECARLSAGEKEELATLAKAELIRTGQKTAAEFAF